jgi:hypothetical protein
MDDFIGTSTGHRALLDSDSSEDALVQIIAAVRRVGGASAGRLSSSEEAEVHGMLNARAVELQTEGVAPRDRGYRAQQRLWQWRLLATTARLTPNRTKRPVLS